MLFHIDGIWAFNGADYLFAFLLIALDVAILYLSRTFMSKV
ncbi:hypothetical protein [Methanosarcina sp. KYL-1]|nr:hypothetical protein [Methanosarcina sp. KYL-1]